MQARRVVVFTLRGQVPSSICQVVIWEERHQQLQQIRHIATGHQMVQGYILLLRAQISIFEADQAHIMLMYMATIQLATVVEYIVLQMGIYICMVMHKLDITEQDHQALCMAVVFIIQVDHICLSVDT